MGSFELNDHSLKKGSYESVKLIQCVYSIDGKQHDELKKTGGNLGRTEELRNRIQKTHCILQRWQLNFNIIGGTHKKRINPADKYRRAQAERVWSQRQAQESKTHSADSVVLLAFAS
jgi:hypothetical protein